jgi:hypothetical protein
MNSQNLLHGLSSIDPISIIYKGQTFIILFNGLCFVIGQSSNKATTSSQPFHLWACYQITTATL